MKLEMAPLEGITTYVYRNTHAKYFGKMDKYYTPFLSLHKEKEFNHKERQEILPENNEGLHVVPQVLTNSAEDFLRAAEKLKAMGYEEININMGCPSGTVTAKAKGAGMLDDPMRLDKFLAEIFERSPVEISVKTRLGMDRPEEWEDLLRIYNKYPLKELIIHARVRADFYQNTPNWDAFAQAVEGSRNPLCYNGDIFALADYNRLTERFPSVDKVMLGRGILANPFLPEELYGAAGASLTCRMTDVKNEGKPELGQDGGEALDNKEGIQHSGGLRCEKDVRRLHEFHDELYTEYGKLLSGDRNILFKMKELWTYMVHLWPEVEKHQKAIRKAKNCSEYEIYVKKMFRELMS